MTFECASADPEAVLCSNLSASSKKTMHGARRFATVKMAAMVRSDLPAHCERTFALPIERKATPALTAIALASAVLPVPGGPVSSKPGWGSPSSPRTRSCSG